MLEQRDSCQDGFAIDVARREQSSLKGATGYRERMHAPERPKGKPPRYYVVHFANDQIEQLLPGLRQRVRERLGLPSSAEISTADPKLQADRPAKETAARGVPRHPAGVLDPPHLSSQGRRQTGPRPLKREGVVEGMLADYSADASALAGEKQETLKARYGVSRDTAEKARRVCYDTIVVVYPMSSMQAAKIYQSPFLGWPSCPSVPGAIDPVPPWPRLPAQAQHRHRPTTPQTIFPTH